MRVVSLPVTRQQVADRFQQALSRVKEACLRSGRPAGAVTIVGVTKYVGAEETRWLAEAGCLDLGESRPQMIWEKGEQLRDQPIRWHLIGHLQRNKVARTLPFLHCIHSVDSERLLKQMVNDSVLLPGLQPISLLIEVNISSDASKTGLSFDDAKNMLKSCKERWGGMGNGALRVIGLMGMSSFDGDEWQARREFESLRLFRDASELEFGISLPHLSMGMSNDFEWAIEEGATMVRLGSTLFVE